MADTKQGKQNEDLYNGSPSRIVLAKPKLGSFGSSGIPTSSNKGTNQFGLVLRPPQLKPSCNLFTKVTSEESSVENKIDNEKSENKSVESVKDSKDDDEGTPKFVPLGNANVTPKTTTTAPARVTAATAPSVGFVFGQNLSERVVMKEAPSNGESQANHSSTNGTSALLFTSAAATVRETASASGQEEPVESLAAAAAEYERSHARPPPPTTNCTATGEEGEANVLQMTCRLFAWEAGGWRERGRGVLRLNDGAGGGSRLVARAAGSLRVALNTLLWPDMVLELAGAKSLRITAADAQLQVKLFLIMGAPADIAQLHRALQVRVAKLKRAAAAKASDQCGERLRAAVEAAPEAGRADEPEAAEDSAKAPKRREQADEGTSPKRPCRDESVQ